MRKPMVVAMLVATAACFPAAAQSPAAPAGRPGMRPDRAAMMKARTDDIALLIGLRPEQRAGLDALLEHPMSGGVPDRGPMPREADGGPPSFGSRIAEMEKHDAAAHQRVAAIKAFYQGLDSQQRARFEAIMRLRGGPGHGFGPPPGFAPGSFGRPPMMGGMPMRGMPGGPEGDGPPL